MLAARSPVEAVDHSLVEVAGHILAEAADRSLVGDAVVHTFVAVVAGHIHAVAVAGGIDVDHSPQNHRTDQALEFHTVLVEVLRSYLLESVLLSRPGCHMTSQLRPRAS